MKSADAYLKQAEELRCGHVIVQRNGSPYRLEIPKSAATPNFKKPSAHRL
jgi:hypothetical protein